MTLVILLLLSYALVTAVLTVLSHQAGHQIKRYNLLHKTKTRRLEYELSLIRRQKELHADIETNVDILDDDELDQPVAGQIQPNAQADARRAA